MLFGKGPPREWDEALPDDVVDGALASGTSNGGQSARAPVTGTPILDRLDTVQSETVQWLWHGRIPLGKVSELCGDPGLGKSTLLLDIAARVSRGDLMPDGAATEEGGVVVLSAEDSVADTIVPRLAAHGADLGRIVSFRGIMETAGQERSVGLPTDLPALRKAIEESGAVLVIVDPLMAYLDGHINSWKDHDVRRALAPLAQLANATGVAVVLVRHLTKGTGPAIYRSGGSIALTAAVRCSNLCAKDPQNDTLRVFACIKSNLAREPDSLAYRLESTPEGVAHILWGGVSHHRADALVAVAVPPEDRDAEDEAREWLQGELPDGARRTVKDINRAARDAGIAERTLRRARKSLGIRAKKVGPVGVPGGAWVLEGPKTAKVHEEGPSTQDRLSWPPSLLRGRLRGTETTPEQMEREALRDGL